VLSANFLCFYSLADEAPIFLLVFAVPALAAIVVWAKLH
jgi:hypothetical protein